MNKQIIIDGVDVSECESFSRTETQVTVIDDCVRKCLIVPCNAIPNCYYKQLQRLKAENKKLKNNYRISCLKCEYKNTKIENEQLKAENGSIRCELDELKEKHHNVLNLAKISADTSEYCMRELEERNNELKIQNESLRNHISDLLQQLNELKEAQNEEN